MTALHQLKDLGNSQPVTALIWTLFHSLWQGSLFAIVAGIVISTTKQAKPTLRYNLLCVLLLLFVVTSILTYCYQYNMPQQRISFFNIQMDLYADMHLADQISGAVNFRSLLNGLLTKTAVYISQHTGMIAAVWLVFFFIKTARMIFTFGYTAYLRSYKSVEPSIIWIDKFDVLRAQLSLVKPVRLIESALLKIPVVYGYFKPVIFFPLGLLSQLPPGQIEAILLHELAHIRRKDYLVNLLQQFVEVVFFFNPALLWIAARIREEREHCCDELAIAHTGNRRHYAEALISFKGLSLNSSLPGALAFTGVKSGLVNRVSRIVSKQNHGVNLIEKSVLFICGLVLLFFLTFYETPSKIILSPVHFPAKQTNEDFPLGKVITEISGDFVKEGIQNNTALSFELTNSGLLINGVRQPDELWQKFYTKYLKSSPYPIKAEYRNNPGFGIFYNAGTHVLGIGTKPPSWSY
jgi:bla regulator protein BlaR1